MRQIKEPVIPAKDREKFLDSVIKVIHISCENTSKKPNTWNYALNATTWHNQKNYM